MSVVIDAEAIAAELVEAYSTGTRLSRTLSSREGFSLQAAYAVEAALARLRSAAGRRVVGRKVAFANAAVWPTLKIDTVAWASMYDDTVQPAETDGRTAVPFTFAPKLEPEIVFKLRTTVDGDPTDPVAVLGAVEWLSLGYEIVDCPFADWTFQPPDLVAAFGFHAGLVLGRPTHVTPENLTSLAGQLSTFTLTLFKNDVRVEQGGGRNVLQSPALALGELAAAIRRTPGARPLQAGELVSTGSLTTPPFIGRGETWRAEPDGLDVASLTMAIQS
jgi:2-oxo-3-hexenedioate decarboxylase